MKPMDYALTKKLLGLFLALSFPATAALMPPILAVTLNEPRTTDSLALVALYDSSNGANWTTKTNWKTSNPIDTWYGVSVSSDRVTHLDLTYNNLTGKLTSAIGDLTGLISLKLGSNYMTGSIPGTIGNITSLEELYIHANQFTGTIPTSVGNLSNLRILYLQLNGLTGAVPMEIGNLSQVTLITVSGNNLSDSIPSQLGNLGNLTGLYLNGNNFSGSIPPAFGNLTNLQYLTLSNNQLSGSIPAELGSLSQLEWLWLADNHLSGTIPSQLGNMTNLRQLYLDHNTLSGSLPSLTTLTSLEELRIQSNRLDVLPDLTSITSLINLIIDHNQFTFEDIEPNIDAPSSTFTYSPQDSVGSYKDTTAVSGSSFECAVSVGGDHNQYQWYKNGSIIGGATSASYTIPSVTYLDSGTYHCRITNTVATALTLYSRTFKLHVIPSLRTTDSLALVALYDSTGGPNWTNKTNWKSSNPITTWFGVVVTGDRVAGLSIGSNHLVGLIPHSIGLLTQLTVLDLYQNELAGQFPTEIGNLTHLQNLNLSRNQLSGSIPAQIGNLTALTYLGLYMNSFSGPIPSQVGNLSLLTGLELHYNQLSGPIPLQIGNLTQLRELRLCNNMLSGDVPGINGLVNLQRLDVSSNQLSGLADLNILSNLIDLSIEGNQFTFEDIEPNIGVPSSSFIYAPQDSVGEYKDTTVEVGSTKELTILVGGASNQYQWYKNGSFIGGATSATYTIPSVAYLDSGTYYCRITNTIATTLTLYSRTFTLHVTVIPPPTISSFSPTLGPIGTSVTITGNNFNTTASNNVVYFGAVKGHVTNAASTELTVIVPTGTTYAPITVTDTTTGLTAYSSKPFVVTFPSSQVIDATSFASKVDFTAGAAPYTVAVGDLDGDGKPDVAVANEGSGMLSIFRNTSTTGSCDFATKADFATGVSPRGVAVGDVDGDGKPDVVVTNNGGTTISVYRNTSTIGAITLDPKVDFAMGNGPNTVAIGDVDGDGKADLVVASEFSSGMISIFRNAGNLGTISFAAKVDSVTGSGPWGVAIGDLDGDGKPDIVNANAGNNTISVFRNTSTGGSISIDPKVDFATGSYPLGVAIGDVDADGKPDVVVTNYSGATVSVFRNTSTSGSISLDVKADFATGSVPAGVALGDMDGDGKADIATANYSSSTVSVLRNTSSSGTIGLAGKVDFATGSAPVGVVISDMDGDGKPDLAATNQGNSTVSVLRNTSLSGRALDSLALVALYDNTGGDNWTNKTNWKSGNPIDTWHGVAMSPGARVLQLYLPNNNLVGQIPISIGNLLELTWLNLSGNSLSGPIPIQIANLKSLLNLDLRTNLLSGTIPSQLGNMTNLQYLFLHRNLLSGSIPHEIGNAVSLRSLFIGYNQLTGAIPDEIGNLSNLEVLNVRYNQLTGAVPVSLAGLTKLQVLRLNANHFIDLPDFTPIDSLEELSIDSNRFTFEDIEPNIGGPNVSFIYSPQDSVGNYSDVVTLPGVNLLLSVTVGGTHNQYQWLKDGIDIPGATGSEYNLLTSTGKYHCRITNTVATDLTLHSRSTTVTTYPLPAPPSNLTAIPVSASRIFLNWTASPDAVKYFVYRYPPGSSFALIDSVAAPATTYTDTGLTLVTTYNYHVVTMNQFRWMSVNSSDVSAATLGIAPTLGTPNVSNPSPIPSAAVTITVTATGTSPTVKLLYGKTTQTEGDSLTMTYNGINYSGTIPGSSVTQEGVWYRIRAQNTGGMVYYPATSRASISVTINDMATIWDNSHFYGGIPKEQYFTIAMSMDASLSLTELWGAQILEDGIPTNWRAWEFDQPTQSFVDVTSLSGDKAYFIYHRQGSAQEIFNSATSRKTNDPQMFGNIVLSPQWNAVPWPYTFPANIFVKDLNQDSIGSVWKLWGVSGWEQVTEMRAFGGYMIYNKTGGNVRLGDVVDWTMMAVKPAVDQTGWRLRFIAESGEYRDAFNFAGVSENFTTLSEPEPVSVGKNVGLYFMRGDLTLSGDIRSANVDGHVWDMIVRNNTGKNRTKLTWDMMGALTSDVKVILVDVTNNQCIELDETVPYYEFRNQNQNRFKLVAGNAGYVLNEVNKIKAQLPDELMLSQNYPNPFNPTTTIKFDVARSGHVRITVYNILGQSVVTLADGYFETGKGYRLTWNGKDVSGREVASGIYICRLESGKFSKVKKMLLVK